jgi:type IV pilus assembly protein PilV
MKATYSAQRGSVLLEALIAILIFSLGILAIVGLQATAINLSSDAKYRTDATLLANQVIGQMFVSDRTPTTLQSTFAGSSGSGGSEYMTWVADVADALPGVSGNVANQPSVSVVPNATNGCTVTVTVNWQLPGGVKHNATSVAQII